MTLKRWIESRGGSVKVAKKLGVHDRTVRFWMEGLCCPRSEKLFEIVRLSRGKVSVQQIVRETQGAK